MRKTPIFAVILLAGLLAVLSAGARNAAAYREPQRQPESAGEEWLEVGFLPDEQFEGVCGLAVQSAAHALFVSDYYHRTFHTFTTGGTYESTTALKGGGFSELSNKLNAICGLAVDAEGHLYGEELHDRVQREMQETASQTLEIFADRIQARVGQCKSCSTQHF